MKLRHSLLFVLLGMLCGFGRAQDNPQTTGPVIRTETKVVLVDVVVTDKKGNYVRDLTAKDFKVWEDNKEQNVSSFSFEADAASPTSTQPRYLVLFFDNASMEFAQQAQAREAAAKFIDANAGPNRLMAIVNYGGSLQIAQNFTADTERLKATVKGIKFSSVSTTESRAVPLSRAASDFGVRDVILALRSLAKNLASVPGRKTLIMLTAGFPVSPELLSEVTATIDACNKANVAIYPIDARGLVTPNMSPGVIGPRGAVQPLSMPVLAWTDVRVPPAAATFFQPAFFSPPQRGGPPAGGGSPPGGGARPPSGGGGVPPGGGGGVPPGGGGSVPPSGGGRPPGGGSPVPPGYGGSRPPNGGYTPPAYNRTMGMPLPQNPFNQPRLLIPKFPESATTNQNVMYMLAQGTGGFVIVNTNDLLAGLEKIGKEQNEYYLLGYTPPDSEEGSCHQLRVKVDRGGTNARARTGYCNARSRDQLAQSPVEKVLESRAAAQQAGSVAASMQAPFFYTQPNTARVNVAMEIPSEGLTFEKEKGKFHSVMNVLGIAYRQDGSVAARFSDSVKFDLENKKEVEAFKEKPYHYENQFDIASGQYKLKVVFSSIGENFGKVEAPLVVEPNDGKRFGMSGVAFSTHLRKAADLNVSLDAALIEDRTPLIAQGFQIIPSGTNRFRTTDKPALYFEVYEPAIENRDPEKPLAVALQMRVLDSKTGEQKVDTGLFRIALPEKNGNPAIPCGMQLPVASLAPGAYRMELSAMDSGGNSFKRVAEFVVQ